MAESIGYWKADGRVSFETTLVKIGFPLNVTVDEFRLSNELFCFS